MSNAKTEFLEQVGAATLLCAKLTSGDEGDDDRRDYVLCQGYTKTELDQFLQSIDFEYDRGYGGQNLFGYIWYSDGTWSDRSEYDGSERWQHQKCPPVPVECTPKKEEE